MLFNRLCVFVSLAVGHVTSRPLRTALTVAGVGIGVAATLGMSLANRTVFEAFQRSVTRVAGEAAIHLAGADGRLDERLLARIRTHPDVRGAHPFIAQSVMFETDGGTARPALALGLDVLDSAGWSAGDSPRPASLRDDAALTALLDDDAIFLGRDLAASLGVGRGDRVTVRVDSRHFDATVRGVWPSSARAGRGDAAVMDMAAAQVRFARLGHLDGVDLVTAPGVPVDRVMRDLRERLGPSVLVSRSSQRHGPVRHMLTSFQLNLTALSAVGLLVGMFLVYNAVGFSVAQSRREIGMLRAIGMRRGQIGLVFLGEAVLVGAVGGALGAALGSGLAHWLVAIEAETVTELYGMETSGVPAFSLSVAAGGCLLGMALSVVGALGPCREASRTAPARALAPGQYDAPCRHDGPPLQYDAPCRHDGSSLQYDALRRHDGLPLRWTAAALAALGAAGLLSLPGPVNGLPVFGYAAAFCVLLGCALLAPLGLYVLGAVTSACAPASSGVRLAVDQIAASPARNCVTLSAFMVGIAIVVGVGVMVASFRDTVERWIDQTFMADFIVAPHAALLDAHQLDAARGLPPDVMQRAGAVPGVAAVDPYRQARIQVGDAQVWLVARDLALHAERSRYLFVNGDSSRRLRRAVAERGAVVSEVLARRLGVGVGDELTLPTAAGRRDVTVVGVFYDYATDGGKVVIDRSLYRTWWGDETATVLGVYLAPEANPMRVRRELRDALAVAPAVTSAVVASAVTPTSAASVTSATSTSSAPVTPAAPAVVVVANHELRADVLAVFDRTFRLTHGLEAVAVVVGLLGIMNTLLTTVLERRRELATFRAIGAGRGQVRGLVLRESLCLGVVGLALGLLGGVLLAALLIYVINKQSFGWTIQMTVPAHPILTAVLIAAVTSLAAGWLPARWATRGAIAEGLREE